MDEKVVYLIPSVLKNVGELKRRGWTYSCTGLFFFLMVMTSLSTKGQNGYLDKYSSLMGNHVVSRVTLDGNYMITCYKSSYDITNFVVTDGSVSYNYSTSDNVGSCPDTPNPELRYGYIVRDMKVVGDTCWFCGSYWRETGERIQNLQGQSYGELLYSGIIGYFLLPQMTKGECQVRYVTIPQVKYLNKMVVYPKGVAAVGEYESDKSLIVDLDRSDPMQWSYELGKSSFSEEVFKDITYAGGKIVVLSRFNNPQHYMYYTDGIGLRYGAPGSFVSTSQQLYGYFVSYATGVSELNFDPEGEMVLDKTYSGEGVVVGYICNPIVPQETYRGRLVQFVVDAENDHHPEYLISNQRYKRIKDMSSIGQNKRVVLLEDSLGNSVFRFSQMIGYAYEKILSLDSGFNDMGIYSGGFYPELQNRISCLYESAKQDGINSWNTGNCASKTTGGSTKITSSIVYPDVDEEMISIMSDTLTVKEMKFYPSGTVAPTRECTDAN